MIIAEELKIPYDSEYIDFSVIKQEPFISVNPNGRVPAIEDPNTGITVWEVCSLDLPRLLCGVQLMNR